MKPDPAIEEVRSARRVISRAFGNDAAALVEHYQEYQKRFADRLVHGPESNIGDGRNSSSPAQPSTERELPPA